MADAGIRSEAFAEAVRALNAVDFRQLVSSIQAPILFVNGGRDRGYLRFEASFIAAARSASSHRFPGVEHGVSIWRSEEFAEITAEFAGRVFETARGPATVTHAQ
jgi:pimeloyl-ACP methyl ester carboxylesterase